MQDVLSQNIKKIAGSPSSGESEKIDAGKSTIHIESTGIGARIRVSYDVNSTGLPKTLSKFDEQTAKKIHEATENTLNMRKELERVPTMSMFTAKYE